MPPVRIAAAILGESIMNATEALELQKQGIITVVPEAWEDLFDPRTDEDRELDEWQELERQYIEDCRIDYGGI